MFDFILVKCANNVDMKNKPMQSYILLKKSILIIDFFFVFEHTFLLKLPDCANFLEHT
jgi:hypothetical protein